MAESVTPPDMALPSPLLVRRRYFGRRLRHTGLLVAINSAIMVGVALQYGLNKPWHPAINHVTQLVIWIIYALVAWWQVRLQRQSPFDPYNRQPVWILFVIVAAALCNIMSLVTRTPGWHHVFELGVGLMLLRDLARFQALFSRVMPSPGLMLPISFFILIVVGTLLLKLPRATPVGQSITWLDALFTMTSAVCVTGLIVRDTATAFTPFGQTIVAAFIQLGGLGIVVFGSMLAMVLGQRLALRQDLSLREALNDQPLSKVATTVRFVVLGTLLIELLGGLLLAASWPGHLAWSRRMGLGMFHAISAYCNAGFALQTDSLESMRFHPAAHLVFVPLIVLGGIGFPVLMNLASIVRARLFAAKPNLGRAAQITEPKNPPRLSLHSKLVLSTTAGLYLFGVIVIGVGQLEDHLQPSDTPDRSPSMVAAQPMSMPVVARAFADAHFMSVTARTAGFNTMPMQDISPAGRFGLILLMLVGASPGGTGGGMKTTTLVLMLLAVVAVVRQRPQVEAFGRHIADRQVLRAGTLAASFLGLICAATLLLSMSEPFAFSSLLFEVVSAASTTGLSLGITSSLSAFGKWVIIATMFLGRVGPLALLAVVYVGHLRPKAYAYPQEDVLMG